MPDGTLRTILEGSLPDEAIEIREARGAFADWRRVDDRALAAPPEKPKAKPPKGERRVRPGCWSTSMVADEWGVSRRSVQRHVEKHETLRAMLKVPGVWPVTGIPLTIDEVRAAGEWLMRRLSWAPKLWLDACVRCGLSDSPHHTHGLCRRCDDRAMRERQGKPVRKADHRAWSRSTGRSCCMVCRRNSVPHYCNGRCHPCGIWWTYHDLDNVPGRERQAKITARRRSIKTKGRGA